MNFGRGAVSRFAGRGILRGVDDGASELEGALVDVAEEALAHVLDVLHGRRVELDGPITG